MPSPTPLYLCAPTASGKTGLAVALAHRIDGEIVNADAYQLYSGIETIAATPTPEEQSQASHHLYGVLSPDENCDAMRYREMALPVIEDIQNRGKTPLITGGSGMYLKFLTHGVSPVPSGDDELRKQLETRSNDDLIRELRELDPPGAESTNLKNRRYVIRALEICLLSGQRMSDLKNDWKKHALEIESQLHGIYLHWEPETLRQRINQRTRQMILEGAVEEVRQLLESPTTPSSTCVKAIGIPQISAHLRGELSLEDCIERLAAATRQYAKRQRTWFRKETWLKTYPVDESTDIDQLAETIAQKI